MPVVSSFHFLERNMRKQYLPGGQGWKWHYRLTVQMVNACRAASPVRSGNLRDHHKITGRRSNGKYIRANIVNDADHAEYVHGGTGPALAGLDGDGWLYLPAGGPSVKNSRTRYPGQAFPRKRLRQVRGQIANPWLDNACAKVAVMHGGQIIG